KGESCVVEKPVGIPDALDVGRRNTEAVDLHARQPGEASWKAERGRVEPAEIHDPAEVELKDLRFLGAELDEIDVGTELESMLTLDPTHVVGPLEAALDAVHGGKGLPPEERESGYVHAQATAAGKLREPVVQAAAGELEPSFVKQRVRD